MIVDAYQIPQNSRIDCDICIVGAGAAGITLAHELRDCGLNVVLLESGGTRLEAETQKLYEGEILDPNHGSLVTQRQRFLGGTTNVWGGRCAPFDDIDFEHRPYVPHSGWPITKQDLDSYYARAHVYCELGSYRYDAQQALPGLKPMMPGFDCEDVDTEKLWLFSPPTNFRKAYVGALRRSERVKVFLHANCLKIVSTADANAVDHLIVSSLRGNQFFVHARHYVLAAGCLEVTRLLLTSNERHAQGIGNQSDLVGRFYMGHLTCEVAEAEFNLPGGALTWNYQKTPESVYCRHSLAVKEQKQRQEGLLNLRAILTYPQISNPEHKNGVLSATYLAKSFLLNNQVSRIYYSKELPSGAAFRALPEHLKNVLLDSREVVRFTSAWMKNRVLSKRKLPSVVLNSKSQRFTLHCDAEQAPNFASRVMLSEQKDALGLHQLKVDWKYTDYDVESISRSLQAIGRAFSRANVGTLRVVPELVEACVRQTSGVGSHHIGTTKMSDSPACGVVDKDCRVHGIGNLYIASSSVFPTSSFANPTLTIVAMAIRVADRLKQVCGRPTACSTL